MNSVLFVSCVSLVTSRDRVKGTKKLGGRFLGARLLHSSLSPVGAMFHNPIQQSLFKADVPARFFALNPLVLQNLCALRKEFLVEDRILTESRLIFFGEDRHLSLFFHKFGSSSTKSN